MPRSLIAQLRQARQDAGLSHAALARALDVSQGSLGNYETGTRRVPLELAARWATACGRRLEIHVVQAEARMTLAPSDRDEALLAALAELPVTQRATAERIVLALGKAHPVAQGAARQLADLLEQNVSDITKF